jgi:WD40 repeat protein/energy-coupling factor transporter ATP-binding protein EcfA2
MLVEAVQKQSLVAVIGPSGSGKSSVVFAGLIPQLRSERTWLIEAFRPGDRPFRNLAAKLVPLLETQMSETDQLLEINKLATALRQGDLRLRDAIARILEKKSGDRLLLVVDQFEELYTLCRDARERLLFLDNLLEASDCTPNFTLVLTLRADFLGQALSYRPFGDALQYADLKLSPMNHEELQAAVEQPAAMLGVTIESGLTERILEAVSTQPGDLPLLEFALNQLWSKQRDAQLTHAAYEEIGGVEAALSRYAEEAYGRLNEEEKERARRIFIQLVRPGEGTEDTRRLATRTEVGEENWDLVTRLANARLVVSSRDEALGEETVEIVHEALIGGWERLNLWIELDRNFRTWQERLRASLRQWEASGKDEGALLRGVPLAEAEGWLVSRAVELSPAERVFIQISLELRDRERKEQLRLRQRTIFGLAGSLVVVSILAGGTFWQWQQAEIGRTNAELINRSATSEALFISNQEFEALSESIRAGRQLKRAFAVEADTRMQVILALQQAVYGVRERNRLEGRRVSFSPDGKMLASVSLDSMKLWSLDGRKVRTIQKPFADVSFSPDGRILATASYGSTVKLWGIDGTLLKTFKGQDERSLDADVRVSFSPDGKMLASASDDGTAKLWGIDGTLLKTFKGQGDGRTHSTDTTVSFSPDGKRLAVISSDGTMVLWNTNGSLLKILEGIKPHKHKHWNTGVSFSPDGKMLASANLGLIRLWNRNGTLLKTLRVDQIDGGNFGSLSFSPDSKLLAVVVAGNTVKLWSLDKGKFKILKANSGKITSLSFSPDGKMLVTASNDDTVKLWSLGGKEPTTLKGHGDSLKSFSPDGKMIATASENPSENNTVKFWSRSGTLLKTLKGQSQSGYISTISFSPNSKTLAVAIRGGDNPIKLWSTDGTLLKTFEVHGTFEERAVEDLSFSPDGKILVSGTADGTIKFWSTDGNLLKSLKGHEARVTSVSFSPDGKMLASASWGAWDNTVKLWNREGTLLKTFNFYSTGVNSVRFSPDGRTIALASLDNTVKLWSVDGRELKTLKGHNDSVFGVHFSPDGKTLVSESFDATVKLWSSDGRELKTFKSRTMRFSPDGKILALTSNDGVILKSLDLDQLLLLGCDWLHDYLKNSPKVNESDKRLCDGIGTQK